MRSLYCFLLGLVCSPAAFATHILGGYIRAVPVTGQAYTYQITVTMYFDIVYGRDAASDANALNLCFGDGPVQAVNRTRQLTLPVDPGVGVHEYVAIHTYNGPGVYQLQATMVNRSTGLRNIGVGGEGTPFSTKTSLLLSSSLPNATPSLVLPSTGIQIAVNQRFAASMAATDPEGDSLSYAIAYPLTSVNTELASQCNNLVSVTGYQFPNDVRQVGTYRINAKTGLLTWDIPTEQSRYTVDLTVFEWRNGLLLSQSQQEITLWVVDKGDTPVTPPPYEPAYVGVLTAVDDSAPDDLQLTVSPNPSSSGLVQVSLQNRLGAPAVFSVLDTQGRIHQRIDKSQPIDQQHFQLDISNQPAGLYFIRAESVGRQVTRKVVRE